LSSRLVNEGVGTEGYVYSILKVSTFSSCCKSFAYEFQPNGCHGRSVPDGLSKKILHARGALVFFVAQKGQVSGTNKLGRRWGKSPVQTEAG
jgi:hypothetical protein